MSQTVLLSPSINLINEIVLHLKAEGRDYSSNIVVFPGKRPSHFLRKAIGEKTRGDFIPPRIFSIDAFINFIYQEKLGLRKTTLEAIDALAILLGIQQSQASPIGGKSFVTADGFLPVGLKIYTDIEECYIEKISQLDIRSIDTLAEEKIPARTLKGLQSFSSFYEQFYQKVEEGGFSTRSVRYRTVSERIDEIDLNEFKKVIFAGFFAFTASEDTIFRKFLKEENTLFIFQQAAGIEERLKDLGVEPEVKEEKQEKEKEKEEKKEKDAGIGNTHTAVEVAAEVATTEMTAGEVAASEVTAVENRCGKDRGPAIHFYKSPDTHGQVFGLSRMMKEQLDKGMVPDEKTVVVLPTSESLFPLIAHCLPLVDTKGSYNISTGYPVHRTPIFGFLNNLMELIISMDQGRVYLPDYLKFVLHPYTKNIYFGRRSDITRIIFHTIEEIAQKKSRVFARLTEIENDDELLNNIMRRLAETQTGIDRQMLKEHLIAIHRNTIGKFLAFENTADFALKAIEVLTYIHQNSTAWLHPFFQPFAQAFIESMHLISTSAMKDIRFAEPAGYFNLIRRYIMTCNVPFEGTPLKGLQVLGFLETRNLVFEKVFILDVNEEVLPHTRREDTLLPYKARKVLGLPTYQDREKIAAYYLDLLINGAGEVHLFFVEKDKKQRSRFVEKLLWERQKEDKEIADTKYVRSIQYSVKLGNEDPEPVRKTEDMIARLKNEHQYSATSLDTYLKCPLQFYYSYLLKLGEKKGITGEIEKMKIGDIVHKIIKRYFERIKGRQITEDDMDLKEMDNLVDEYFEIEYGTDLMGLPYILKKQIKGRLKEFIQGYQLPVIKRQSVTILEIEHEIKIIKDSFRLSGKIDRIEKRGKETFIIDYKTTGNENYLKLRLDKFDLQDRQTWCPAIKTLQLPFYLMLYSEITGERIEDINAVFLLLGKAVINQKIEHPLFDNPEDIKEHFALLKTVIFKLLEEIVDRQKPFTPTLDKKEHCPACAFNYICGTQWVQR